MYISVEYATYPAPNYCTNYMYAFHLHASHGGTAIYDRFFRFYASAELQVNVDQSLATVHSTATVTSATVTPQPNNNATKYGPDAAASCCLLLAPGCHHAAQDDLHDTGQ